MANFNRNHPLCNSSWVERINHLIFSLGSKQWHCPPILAWAVLQSRRESNDSMKAAEDKNKYSCLLQRAIKGNVFQYLQSMLKITAFKVVFFNYLFMFKCIELLVLRQKAFK